jgi:hypothetical protein
METPERPPREPWSPLERGLAVVGGVILGLVVLCLIFDAGENWLDAKDWTDAQAKLKAAGISIEASDYLPQTVPASENLGALPIFQFTPDVKTGLPRLDTLRRAVAFYDNVYFPPDEKFVPGKILYLSDWPMGPNADLGQLKHELEEYCRVAKPPITVPPTATPSEILGLICPAFAELRNESPKRPSCSFDVGFSGPLLLNTGRNMEFIDEQLRLAKAIHYEETLALLDDHPKVALDDIKAGWKIGAGVLHEPVQVDGLVYLGVAAIHRAAVTYGLQLHAWNDDQLKELDEALGQCDFLAAAQFVQRGDFAVVEMPLAESYKRDWNFGVHEGRRLAKEQGLPVNERLYFVTSIFNFLRTKGSYDEGLADYAAYLLPGSKQLLDVPTRRVFAEREVNFPPPPKDDSLIPDIENSWLRTVKKFAESQAQTDELRIACRLERYRLAHGSYPDSLTSLTVYGTLPLDIMNGEPYHYKLSGDGTYILYSVAWNQQDDGGDSGRISDANGDSRDWVWTNKLREKKK